MQIKANYEIKKVSDRYIVIPKANANLDFNGIITLNKSGKLLFEQLQTKKQSIEQLTKLLLTNYEVEEDVANNDVLAFVKLLKANDLLIK